MSIFQLISQTHSDHYLVSLDSTQHFENKRLPSLRPNRTLGLLVKLRLLFLYNKWLSVLVQLDKTFTLRRRFESYHCGFVRKSTSWGYQRWEEIPIFGMFLEMFENHTKIWTILFINDFDSMNSQVILTEYLSVLDFLKLLNPLYNALSPWKCN